MQGPAPTNWAGNVRFSATAWASPTSVAELAETVARAERVHVLGTGHSFSSTADTDGTLLRLDAMPRQLRVDPATSTVRVSAATRWGELAPAVHAAGFALANMGSLPHISVAGSVATGTHGSGSALGCLASSVTALDLVTSD